MWCIFACPTANLKDGIEGQIFKRFLSGDLVQIPREIFDGIVGFRSIIAFRNIFLRSMPLPIRWQKTPGASILDILGWLCYCKFHRTFRRNSCGTVKP